MRWLGWEPPKTWWKDWRSIINTYVKNEFQLKKIQKTEHQMIEFLTNMKRTHVFSKVGKWKVKIGGRYPALIPIQDK